MNRFEERKTRKQEGFGLNKIIVLVLILLVFVGGVTYFANSQYMDGKNMLSQAIERDMIHCYSVEGYYPPSIEYMEENYGLNYDKEKYLVEYTVISKDIMPKFEIQEK